ncbi:MAG: hypothetical protein J0M15_06035 [Deltaproteobacteria bacterium]|nr:hypothetical protein [Deltaproteobacteria bacterium]
MLFQLKRPKVELVFFVALFTTIFSQADYRVGGLLGLGSTGISSVETISGIELKVNRSDGPGYFGLFVEKLISDTNSLTLGHNRGFLFSPFSSGIGFTGITYRWFFGGPAPSMVESASEQSTMLIKRYAFFLGLEGGIANGTVVRSNDLVPVVSGSGAFMGFHAGWDIQTEPNYVYRYEFVYGLTPPSSGFVKTDLSELAFTAGIYFIY